MKINSFISSLKEKVSGGYNSLATGILRKESPKLLALLRKYSPVDRDPRTVGKKNDQVFRDNWSATFPRFSTKQTLGNLVIKNSTRHYGKFIAYGAEPREAPWYFPTRDKKGQFTKWTGKLQPWDGKIWAGGLHPGKSKSRGGPIANALSEFTDKFTKEFADKFAKGFL